LTGAPTKKIFGGGEKHVARLLCQVRHNVRYQPTKESGHREECTGFKIDPEIREAGEIDFREKVVPRGRYLRVIRS